LNDLNVLLYGAVLPMDSLRLCAHLCVGLRWTALAMRKAHKPKAGLAFAVGLLVFALTGARDPEIAVQAEPPGWYIYPMEKLDSVTLSCLNYSHMSRAVSIEGDRLKITDYRPRDVKQLPLPVHFKVKPEWELRARRHVTKVEGGWLVGIDAGEWGGGLWITNGDGSLSKQIVMDNIKGIIPVSEGIFIFSGLAHMSGDFGNVLMLSDPHDMHVSFEWAAHLTSEPQAFVAQADNSILMATKFGVWRLTPSGELNHLFWMKLFRGFSFYINSIAETADGTIYLGSEAFVLRFRETGVRHIETLSNYSEDLLLPDQCRQLVMSQNQCVCRPQ
jgi:hypothetical protein